MKRVSGRIAAILIIVATVAGLAMILHKAKREKAAAPAWRPRPAPVETADVIEGELSRTLRYLARLEAVAAAEIAPEITARIVSIKVNEGDRVAAGDLLARLDDRDIRAQISAVEAGIKAAQARLAGARAGADAARSNLAYAKREYDRDRRLFEKKGISASALEDSRNRVDAARGKSTQANEAVRSAEQEIIALKARLAEARTRLSYTEIRADAAATLRKRHVEVGDMAMPGKPIFEMIDVSSYQLAFDLVQEDLTWVRSGQVVRIHWPAPVSEAGQSQTVARIFPSLESDQTVRAEIDLFCRCPEQLKVGTLIPLEVVVQRHRGLMVPRTALVPTPVGGHLVYAVRDGRLKQVSVQVVLQHGDQALVKGDLTAGESVAVGEYLQWVRRSNGMAVSS